VFAGAVSIVAAVVLGLVTPIVEAISVGMATAGAVGITFAVGVLVIVVAILIERYQQSMGQKLTRLTDAMADWE
jgi:mannose/fructose/N-acetylgalactosamine-specific phosphotransferase system component IID